MSLITEARAGDQLFLSIQQEISKTEMWYNNITWYLNHTLNSCVYACVVRSWTSEAERNSIFK